MMMVDRYDPWFDGWDGVVVMDVEHDGDWVSYDDYQAQAARIEQLEAAWLEAEGRLSTVEAALATARNGALREAADVVENLWAYRTCREVADAILALITKEAQ